MSALPPEAVALLRRGNAHLDAGACAAAVPCFVQALERAPALAEAWFGLGGALVGLGRAGEAEEACHRGLRHAPAHPIGLSNLGAALSALGRHAAAQGCFEAALGRNPSFAQAHANLANALLHQNRIEAAHAAYERALSHAPNLLDARSGLADLLSRTGQVTRACALASETARQFPDHPASQAARFDLLVRSARFAEAQALASEAEDRLVTDLMAASRRLMGLNLLPDYPAARISAAHAAWGAAQTAAAGPARFASPHDRDPERVLRVAYLSPDLRFHPVGRFLLPLLARHDKARVHITCYDLAGTPDALTRQLAGFADTWRTCRGLGADEFAARIVSDRIDILMDLAGHTHGQRLEVMARRPAPVQVTWLGYLNTTGLRAIDYRLSDAVADPPGPGDALSAERLVRLPNFLCFAPPHDPPPVAPGPGQAGGVLTFGVCGRTEKINPVGAALWAAVLAAVPGSRLRVQTGGFADAGLRRTVTRILTEAGIPAGRLTLAADPPDYPAYLAAFAEIDVLLDTTPYNGVTTTCEALWQGVPVIALAGDRQAARTAASVLTAAGLGDLVAPDAEAYVALARDLAGDAGRLGALREGLRARLAGSALCDASAFTRSVEAAYRAMWRRFCAGDPAMDLVVQRGGPW